MTKFHAITFTSQSDAYIITASETENGEQKPIAVVDEITGRVIYIDTTAENDADVQKVINKILSDRPDNITISKSGCVTSMKITTERGTLIADLEPSHLMETDYEAMYLSFEPVNHAGCIDILCAKTKPDYIELLAWTDVYSEDYTDKFFLDYEDINDALK